MLHFKQNLTHLTNQRDLEFLFRDKQLKDGVKYVAAVDAHGTITSLTLNDVASKGEVVVESVSCELQEARYRQALRQTLVGKTITNVIFPQYDSDQNESKATLALMLGNERIDFAGISHQGSPVLAVTKDNENLYVCSDY